VKRRPASGFVRALSRAALLVTLSVLGPALAAGNTSTATAGAPQATPYPPVRAGTRLIFPRDHGAHPDYRIEWWYLTGWLSEVGDQKTSPRGFQLTFFRLRPGVQEKSRSAFAPTQLLFAHAALADPALGRLRHAEKSARQGFGLAGADAADTRVNIDDWTLQREDAPGGERYLASVRAEGFAYRLVSSTGAPPLLHGEQGFSQKGQPAIHASYYYSRPQLAVSGEVDIEGRKMSVTGAAWLDHEWSSAAMPPGAVGWDWVGANLDDGGALMAFRLRDAEGRSLWAGGTLQKPGQPARHFGSGEVSFSPQRRWKSPRTGGDYAVETLLTLGPQTYRVVPLFDDQELDSRRSVGAVYWEGAARLFDPAGREVGRGYLEITGAVSALRM
jgi:predicted secreted hydrolase